MSGPSAVGWFFITIVSAWVTHIIGCLVTHEAGFLIAGALFFPIGIFHGVGIWLSAIFSAISFLFHLVF